jgi:ParB/RepB/Spo0J family partition protein
LAESVTLIKPRKIFPNDENPRIIFREDELGALSDSIKEQGILVPLTVFRDGARYTILDGERRWRCALKLGLNRVPVIVQPKPDRLRNIMMMFAIHKAEAIGALPTAQLRARKIPPNGTVLHLKRSAAAASLRRGEVRRYRQILALPDKFRKRP